MDKNKYSSFVEYLSSKKSVDDRALNKNVWNSMIGNLRKTKSPQVIEIGSGTGTMLTRLLNSKDTLFSMYDSIDLDDELLKESKKNIEKWAVENNSAFNGQTLTIDNKDVELNFIVSEIDQYLERIGTTRSYDLIIANAFLDLVNISEILPKLFAILNKGGMFYFSINYDGITDFEPVIDTDIDNRIIELYHKTMDQRVINGVKCCTPFSGKLLYNEILKNKGRIIEAGSSDWFVFPIENKYRFKEDYFLHFIINTIKDALANESSLSQDDLEGWINKRHQQVDRGELVYITHQLDLFGKING